jgi:hypothetical protein
MKKLGILFTLVALVAGVAATAQAADELRPLKKEYKEGEEKPTATFKMESTSIAAGVGVTWGEGVLTFEGKDYPFTVKGLSVVNLGIAKVTTVGDVFRLKKVEDFEGTFAEGAVAASFFSGRAGGRTLANDHGVYMSMRSLESGVQLKFAPGGITFTLVKK